MLGAVADGHALHDFRHFGLTLGGRYIQVAQREFNIFIYIQLINQVEALEHETDVPFAELGALLLLEVCHLGAEEFVTAAGRIVQQAEDVQKR